VKRRGHRRFAPPPPIIRSRASLASPISLERVPNLPQAASMKPFLALLLLVLIPAAAGAQSVPPEVPRFAVTIFTGARLPFSTGYTTAFAADGQQVLQAYEERTGGAMVGFEAEIGTGGPLRLLIGGNVAETGRSDFSADRHPQTGEVQTFAVIYGGASWLAKAGLSYRVTSEQAVADGRRRAATDFFLAPALLHEQQGTHPTLNFGARGAFPVADTGIELTVGVEDYLVFWRHSELQETRRAIFRDVVGAESVAFSYETSHRVMFRVGATLRR
jgi:hypothetical protein